MKILVVGGTGLLGGHAALYLQALGHDVTLAARSPAHPATALAALPFLAGDYVAGDFPAERLAGFDWLLFAAGNDPRHIPPGADAGDYLMAANRDALPALEDLRDREELRFAGRVAFARNWSLFGSGVFNLTNKTEDPSSAANGFQALRTRIGAAYQGNTFQIHLAFRNLGFR